MAGHEIMGPHSISEHYAVALCTRLSPLRMMICVGSKPFSNQKIFAPFFRTQKCLLANSGMDFACPLVEGFTNCAQTTHRGVRLPPTVGSSGRLAGKGRACTRHFFRPETTQQESCDMRTSRKALLIALSAGTRLSASAFGLGPSFTATPCSSQRISDNASRPGKKPSAIGLQMAAGGGKGGDTAKLNKGAFTNRVNNHVSHIDVCVVTRSMVCILYISRGVKRYSMLNTQHEFEASSHIAGISEYLNVGGYGRWKALCRNVTGSFLTSACV